MSQVKREASDGQVSAQKRQKTFHKSEANGNGTGYNKYSRTNQKNGSKENKHEVFHADSSREAHAEQKRVKAERLQAKPNADLISRAKKLWEKLRLKSHVQKEERAKLVAELFEIITGRVKDFVFKHDSVRVIQCALKYATPAQRQTIAEELRGSYRDLAESKYAKFLIAKMIVQDPKVRDLVVPEFYGHVKRLIRHPEAGWIVDDIYRQMATKEQKARLLREWYGAEFVVFDQSQKEDDGEITADLKTLIERTPGKRGHMLTHLKEMTNQLVQKKTHGFTMLHDALLQYFLNVAPESTEHNEFLDVLRDDEDGDLMRNLAFTKSGSRIVCLAFAYGAAKDRRNFLKHFKSHVKALAADPWGHVVFLALYECIDDTVTTAKALFGELTGKDLGTEEREQELLLQAGNLNARIPLLFLMAKAGDVPKWLLDTLELEILAEIREIRKETSKKDPETRRVELNKALSRPLLDFIVSQAQALLSTSFGCQFIGEVLLGASDEKETAVQAVAETASGDQNHELLKSAHVGRLFKSLCQGGRFDATTKTVILCEPRLRFAESLYAVLKKDNSILDWARGENAFAILAMVENDEFEQQTELKSFLQKHQKELEKPVEDQSTVKAGTNIILEKIGNREVKTTSRKQKPGKKEK